MDMRRRTELAVTRAIDHSGGAPALALALTLLGSPISSQAIYQWKRVPIERARFVAKITGIPVSVLRPDVWPTKPNVQGRLAKVALHHSPAQIRKKQRRRS
jgi:DNA-binding transcriptional regulator YdaS (Cro superfamily)